MKIEFTKDELEHLMASLEGYLLILNEQLETFKEDEPHLEPFSKEYEQGIQFLKNHKIELEMTNKLCFKIHNKISGVNWW